MIIFDNKYIIDSIQKYRLEGFDQGQLYEVLRGYQLGLNQDQIDMYAKKSYQHQKMYYYRNGLQTGLEVSYYDLNRHSLQDLNKIRLILVDQNVSKQDKGAHIALMALEK